MSACPAYTWSDRDTVDSDDGQKRFIVQTVRHSKMGNTILLECFHGANYVGLILPPKVAEMIARQRRALDTRGRRRLASSA